MGTLHPMAPTETGSETSMAKSTNGSSTPKIPDTPEKQAETRRRAKQQTVAASFNPSQEASERQLAALRGAIRPERTNPVRASFLDAFVAVYGELTPADLKVGGSRTSATFRRVEAAVGADILAGYRKDWSQAKSIFARAVAQHPHQRYLREVHQGLEAAEQARFEGLTQSLAPLLGSLDLVH